jgi:hypothetical protein
LYRTLVYNADGSLASVTMIDSDQVSATTNFQYAPNMTIINEHDGGPDLTMTDSVFFDSATGLISGISYTRFGTNPNHYYHLYHYTNNLLDSVEGLADGFKGFTYYYKWQGKDKISDSNYAAGVLRFTYYTDKPALPPIFYIANNYQYLGRPTQPSEHLLKDVNPGTPPLIHHTYAFDRSGKIIADTLYPSQPQDHLYFETYKYTCQ